MSESAKMGLFGSKDKNKEAKKEASKVGPHDRYSPYCIDSDSETYDTEALSIMDINDIIGVQSEPVGDSTLESEIAALSEIITESKSESGQSIMDSQCDMRDVNLSEDQECFGIESLESVTGSLSEQLKSEQELSADFSGVHDVTSVCSEERLALEKLTVDDELNVLENIESNSQINDTRTDLKDVCESSVSVEPSIESIIDESSNENFTTPVQNVDILSEKNTEISESTSMLSLEVADPPPENEKMETLPLESNENIVNKTKSTDIETTNTEIEEQAVELTNEVSSSLQLIGEAYTSEDSQETTINETETKDDNVQVPTNDDPVLEDEQKSESIEPAPEESTPVLQEDINKPLDAPENISTAKTCADENIPVTAMDVEPETTEADHSKDTDTPKVEEEPPDTPKETEEETFCNDTNIPLPSETEQPLEESKENIDATPTEPEIVASDSPKGEEPTETTTEEATMVSESASEKNDKPTDTPMEVQADQQSVVCETSNAEVAEEENLQVENIEKPEETESATTHEEEKPVISKVDHVVSNEDMQQDVEPVQSESLNETPGVNEETVKDVEITESTQEESETTQSPTPPEPEKMDVDTESLDTLDNCNISLNVPDILENLENLPKVNNEKIEKLQEVADDSLKTPVAESDTETLDAAEKSPELVNREEKEEEEVAEEVPKTEEMLDNTPIVTEDSVTNIEQTNSGVEENTEPEPSPEIDTDQLEPEEPPSEVSTTEKKIDDSPEQCSTVNTEQIADAEIFPEAENESVDLNPVSLESQSIAAVDNAAAMDASAVEEEPAESEIIEKMDTSSDGNAEELCDTKSTELETGRCPEKIEEPPEEIAAPTEEVTKLPEEIEVSSKELDKLPEEIQAAPEEPEKLAEEVEKTSEEIEKSPITEDTTNIMDTTEMDVEEEKPPAEEQTDINVNAAIEEETDTQESQKIEEESSPVVASPAISQTTDLETANDGDNQNGTEESIVMECNDKTIPEMESDIKENEPVDDADKKEIFEVADTDKSTFSPTPEQADIVIPEEDAEEEHIEEEMNLTLDPEESEMQLEAETENPEEPSSHLDLVDTTEKEKEPEEMDKEAEMNAIETFRDDVCTEMTNEEKTDDVDTNLESVACSSDVDLPLLSKDPESPEDKQDLEDNLQGEVENNNLKSILETADNDVDMFSEEQCQNTQDIVTSILDDDGSATDFKNILGTQSEVENEIENDLQQSAELVEAGIKELSRSEKLPQSSEDMLNKDMEDPMSSQNMDSLEGLLGLDLIPEGEDSTLKTTKLEETSQTQESLEKEVDMALLLEQANPSSDIAQTSDYISDVISSCLTNASDVSLENITDKGVIPESIDDKPDEAEANELLKASEAIMSESISKDDNAMDLEKHLEVDADLPENDLDMDFEGNTLESADLDEAESKLDLAPDILLQNVDQSESLNDAAAGLETSQPSSEISELESAVKFLQESEEQAIDSPLVLSPKMVESVVEDISKQANASSLFVTDEDICEDTSELVAELQNIATDPISISEAEIISEAAKLENERKLAQQVKMNASSIAEFESDDLKLSIDEIKGVIPTETEGKLAMDELENIELQGGANIEPEKVPVTIEALSQNVLKVSETIPKISILEERLKEPPKIEIPFTDVTKVSISPTTSKDSLLIQKDAKMLAYQKMLESPKLSDKGEPKIMDTPRKDSDKHDFENVGSPRIILKIAKSAIADCSEPRSPKSPKIRSATNSPNPEDSPGQKLGKIKLKLSKSGHPSIISNENIDEAAQWHSEGSASLSPLGMKIKLSKSGDASIVSSEKHEAMDDAKEPKHKFEEAKRTESPIGMKIKLSKSGDASIVQDSKDIAVKHKDKLDIVQGSPKRTESPIGMKIKLSKSGDASIIQLERQDITEDYKDSGGKTKEKVDMCYGSPKRTDSPIGMKIKLSKTGDASIVSPDVSEDGKETSSKLKEKLESSPEIPKRTESPIGMKIKLTKTKGGASIISVENTEDQKEKTEVLDVPKRTESPLGMKIKLSKSGDASIIHSEVSDEPKDAKQKEKLDSKEKFDVTHETTKSTDLSSAMKIKVMKVGETSMIAQESEESESAQETLQKVESPIGMKIKLSKFGDASIISTDQQEQSDEHRTRDMMQDIPKRTESPLGMKIKLSKTGDASIIQTETPPEDPNKAMRAAETEHGKGMDPSLGMKIKLLKTGDASIVDSDKKQRRRDTESPLEMKIKLSKTGHPTIVACDSHAESTHKPKDTLDPSHNFAHRYKEPMLHKESALKILKSGHSTILQSNRSELTIEPVQMQSKKMDNVIEISPKRKEITISPIEPKKSKLETQLSQILPEVTIQPVMSRDQKQLLFDPKTSLISRQQMNVISQEISITQVRPSKSMDTSMSGKLKDILSKNVSGSPMGTSDCEIIEHRPELIIVNENSNSSQDVMIIEEVPPNRMPEVKIPKKRGRPRRNPLQQPIIHPPPQMLVPRDPLALDEVPQAVQFEHRENERPKRTCRNQKSYAPPRRGRGRGRGKRKLDNLDLHLAKKPRIEQDLSAIEASTMAVITMDNPPGQPEPLAKSSELYKALKQPPIDCKGANPACKLEKKCLGHKDLVRSLDVANSTLAESSLTVRVEAGKLPDGQGDSSKIMPKPSALDAKDSAKDKRPSAEVVSEKVQKAVSKTEEKVGEKSVEGGKQENKDMLVPPGHPNWLTPAVKRQENVSTVQVIDEETRMSAESGSRSQTPARNISVQASENIINEESQGSVLSTATTESEKVKVKNRRMEINFDPDEGPFTVDKVAEYEWPLDRKGETFMIQEQISQYLGVKSFKRKYPDLKRRMVDMEERNYLRENGLVSEAMCDMGLTAVCSSEVLDVMCSDFPDQYEEYRKHMREKQIKEHSKKQKELTAAANAEKNRIDLAEMAVQSALSWNINLNKARKENRKCSLDLQTFTIHVPKKQQKVELDRKVSHYPVALIPGQYTDYYREYTAAELRYYPLNTVLYGPMRPNERKFDSQSEGSQSDSDSDSSSDDSSSSSSEGTQDTEGSQSTMDEVDMEIVNQKDEIKLKCKMCLKTLNKHNKNEVLIRCGTCNGNVHPSCIDLTLDMVPHIQSYAWQCTDCKTCAQCHDPADEDKMLFCDMCDRGYHIYCVGLRRVPQGRWHCQECAVCANCGSREPGGINSDRNSVAQWQHEYKKGDKNTRVYVSTLCVPCSKLWRKGRYCPHCSRCHTAPRLDLEANLVHCSACDKYLHLGCVETKGVAGFDRKNYLCDFCTPNRQPVMKPLVSKIFKT